MASIQPCQSRVSSAPAPLGEVSFGQKHGYGSSIYRRAAILLSGNHSSTRGNSLALQHCMARPLVGTLRNEVTLLFNNGGLQWGSVLTRKVGLLASPRCYHSHSCELLSAKPVFSRLENTRARTLRIPPIAKAWRNTRSCSSHASSSLVKMASDRDILSDEYVLSSASKNV